MKILKYIISFITNPLATTFGVKFPEAISKECTKRQIWIFLISLIVTAGIVIYFYFDSIF